MTRSFVVALGAVVLVASGCSAGAESAPTDGLAGDVPNMDGADGLAPADANSAAANGNGSTNGLTRLSFVGEVTGADMAVGVVQEAGRIAIFFCGGPANFAEDTHWFRSAGRLDGRVYSIAQADGWTVRYVGNGNRVRGTVAHDGKPALFWAATPVTPGTLEGLYDGRAYDGLAGLVVRKAADPDAGGLRLQGAFKTQENRFLQIDPFSTLQASETGALDVTLRFADSSPHMLVTPTQATSL
jgi:hypothetical protein